MEFKQLPVVITHRYLRLSDGELNPAGCGWGLTTGHLSHLGCLFCSLDPKTQHGSVAGK